MSKYTFLFVLTAVLLFAVLPAEAKGNYRVTVDGKVQDLVPVEQGKTVLLPLAEIGKSLNLSVAFDSRLKRYTMTGNGRVYILYRNSDRVIVKKRASRMREKLQLMNGTDMIPLQSLTGLMGLKTSSDPKKLVIDITQKSAPGLSAAPAKQDVPKSAPILPASQVKKDALPASSPPAAPAKNEPATIPAQNTPLNDQQPNPSSSPAAAIDFSGGGAMPANDNILYQAPVLQEGPVIQARPNAFVGKGELERAKKRVQNVSWAKAYGNRLIKAADGLLIGDLSVPDKPAGHASWYVCKSGAQLQYQNGKHYCPADKQYYTGEKYDAAWRTFRDNELIQNTRLLAAAYALYDDKRYAEAVKGILLQFAKVYPSFPVQEKGGKLYYQSLDEAVSGTDLAASYDLIYSSGLLTADDKQKIENSLLRPMADSIRNYPMGRSNWQAWHDAAIGVIGAALQDKRLIDEAVSGPLGFTYLMKNGVLNDGFWWEGSMAYHTYALAPLTILAQTASHWGYDLYSNPRLKMMFDVPLLYSYPNFITPSNNDGGKYGTSMISFTSSRGYNDYEAAYAYYKDQNYGWLLNEKYKNLSRNGDFALFFGADQIEDGEREAMKSYNLSSIGQAILRNPDNTEDQNYLLLDYGEHGGAHGHYDKLEIDFYGAGSLLAPDFGTPQYSHPLYRGWYKQTISHNTVTVDGKSQNEAAGKMLLFSSQPYFKHLYAQANSAYDHVTYERGIWMDDEYTLDWFYLNDPSETHLYDWTLHGLGVYSSTLPFAPSPALSGGTGYEQLKAVMTASPAGGWEGMWKLGENGLRVYSIPFGESTVITASAPGPSNAPDKQTTMLMQRKQGKQTQFVTILQPFTSSGEQKVTGEREGEYGIKVFTSKGVQHLYQNYQNLEAGKIASFKGETRQNASYHIEQNVISAFSGKTVNVQVRDIEQFSHLAFSVYAPDAGALLVNGKPALFQKQDGFLIAEVK